MALLKVTLLHGCFPCFLNCTIACNFTKSTTPWVFSYFLNCTNGTKSRNASTTYWEILYLLTFLNPRTGIKLCCLLKVERKRGNSIFPMNASKDLGEPAQTSYLQQCQALNRRCLSGSWIRLWFEEKTAFITTTTSFHQSHSNKFLKMRTFCSISLHEKCPNTYFFLVW